MTIASLPMYDLPELSSATDAWWQGLARAFRTEGVDDVPDSLDRGSPHDHRWYRSDLLFSQTCGYPLTHALAGKVRLVATPAYDAEGCAGSYYCSSIVVRADDPARGLADLRGARCAFNSTDSQSGYSALRAVVAPLSRDGEFFGSAVETGSHGASLAMVAKGDADICAVDCVSLALLRRHRASALSDLRELCRSPSAPGLPYVTRGSASDELVRRLQTGLRRALADRELTPVRKQLLIAGADELPAAAYQQILTLEAAALRQGYPLVA